MANIFENIDFKSLIQDAMHQAPPKAGMDYSVALANLTAQLEAIRQGQISQTKDQLDEAKQRAKDADEQLAAFADILAEIEKTRKEDKKKSDPNAKHDKNTPLTEMFSKHLKKMEDKTRKDKNLAEATIHALNKKVNANDPSSAAGKISPMPGSIRVKGIDGGHDGNQYGDEFAKSVNKSLKYTALAIAATLAGGAHVMNRIFADTIDQEYNFRTGMDIIAMQTQGITADAYEMQKAFKSTANVAATTGFDLTTFQNEFLKLAKRGVKDAASITKSGLHLGKIMGLNEQESAGIADTFADWNQHLGLSDVAINDIARGVKQTARFTGIVGTELIEVVKHSQQYMDKMRAAGTLTSAAANNIIQLNAEAKKLGVQDSISEWLNGITNGADLILHASKETQSTLFAAAATVGRLDDLQNGTLTQTKSGMRDLAKGLDNLFKKFSGGLELGDIDKLDAKSKKNLNLSIKAATGKDLDTFKREHDAIANVGKTFQDRMQDVDKELGINATAEEKLVAQRKKQDLLSNKAFEFSDTLADAAKNATSFDDVIGNLSKKIGPEAWAEQKQELADVAGTFSKELKGKVLAGNNEAIVQAMSMAAAKQIKDKKGTDFTAQLKDAIDSKDLGELREIQSKMREEQKKLGIEEVQAFDPLAEAAKNIMQMNEGLRNGTGPLFKNLIMIAGATGAMAMLMSGAALHSIFGAESALSWGKTIVAGIKKYAGVGVGDVAESTAGGGIGKVASSGFGTIGGTMGKKAGETAALQAVATESTAVANGFSTVTGRMGMMAAQTTAAAEAELALATAAGTTTAEVGLLGSAWAAIWPALALVEGVLGVIGGFKGAFDAAAVAADIFGTSTKKLTLSQHYAASAAGAVTGALDFMTFGVFHKFLAATGDATKWLAQLNEKIPILSAAMAILDVAFGVVWGLVVAIKNIIVGAFELIYLVVEPFGDLFSAMGAVLVAIMSPFTAFNATLGETGSLFQIVSDIIGGVGMAIRQLLRGIGLVVGFIIKIFLMPFIAVTKLVAGAVEGMMKTVGKIFDGLMTAGLGIFQILQGIFTFDFGKLWSGIKNLISGTVKSIVSFAVGAIVIIPETIIGAFTGLFTYLSSLIPDVIKNIVGWFLELPGMIADALSDMISIIAGWATELPGLIYDGLSSLAGIILNTLENVFVSIPTMIWNSLKSLASNDLFGPIFQPFLDILKPIQESLNMVWAAFGHLWEALESILKPFEGIFSIFNSSSETLDGTASSIESTFSWMQVLTDVIKTTASVIGMFIKVALYPLQLAFQAIGAVIQVFAGFIWLVGDAFKFVGALVSSLVSDIIAPFKWLYDTLVGHSIIPDLVEGIIEWFAMLPLNIVKGLISLPAVVGSAVLDSFTNLSTYVFEGLTGVFGKVFTWLEDHIPGLKTAKKVVGAVGDAASAVWEGTKTAASYLNPLSYFGKNEAQANKTTDKSSTALKSVTKTLETETKIKKSTKSENTSFIQQTQNTELANKIGETVVKANKTPIVKTTPKTEEGGWFGFGGKAKVNSPTAEILKGHAIGATDPNMFGWNKTTLGTTNATGVPKNNFAKAPDTSNPNLFDWRDGAKVESVDTNKIGTSLVKKEATMIGEDAVPATPVNADENLSKVQAVPLTDVHARMQREHADTNADAKRSGVEMSALTDINQNQLEIQKQLHEDLQVLIGLMTPSNNDSGSSSQQTTQKSRNSARPSAAPQYNRWQYGKYDQQAATSVISDGR